MRQPMNGIENRTKAFILMLFKQNTLFKAFLVCLEGRFR